MFKWKHENTSGNKCVPERTNKFFLCEVPKNKNESSFEGGVRSIITTTESIAKYGIPFTVILKLWPFFFTYQNHDDRYTDRCFGFGIDTKKFDTAVWLRLWFNGKNHRFGIRELTFYSPFGRNYSDPFVKSYSLLPGFMLCSPNGQNF